MANISVLEDLERLGAFEEIVTQIRDPISSYKIIQAVPSPRGSDPLEERVTQMADGLDRMTECLDSVISSIQDLKSEMSSMRKLWGVRAEEVMPGAPLAGPDDSDDDSDDEEEEDDDEV
jgi:hypothetical protein